MAKFKSMKLSHYLRLSVRPYPSGRIDPPLGLPAGHIDEEAREGVHAQRSVEAGRHLPPHNQRLEHSTMVGHAFGRGQE